MTTIELPLKAALVDGNALYPEVKEIITLPAKPSTATYIILQFEDPEPVETGGARGVALKQKSDISVVRKITRNDNQDEIKTQVQSLGEAVLKSLRDNPRLVSTAYPDGVLVDFGIAAIKPYFSVLDKDDVYQYTITIEAGFWL